MSNLVVHFEIHGSEPQRLIDFYGALLGWRFAQYGDTPYWTIDTGHGSIGMQSAGMGINGGLAQREGPAPAEGAPISGANVVVGVADADDCFAKALELGGAAAVEPEDMAGIGRVGYLRDPDGNVFGIISERLSDGTSVLTMAEDDLEAPMHGETTALDAMTITPEP
ncbi:VOC family protein [Agrococcus beijingensis]|uniref:VOC family protein n=1 Tax=Agrococcus beijingensis TaxID=3068634 RepID=UPI002741485D|nr:VOC family protein [Agrococcus sp. REN33]